MEQMPLFKQSKNDSKSSHAVWYLYVDGASRSNPGPSGAGVYVLKNGESFLKKGFYLGTMTNNQAEYQALLLGLFLLSPILHPDDEVHIYADSQLMIRQLQGKYKVIQPALKILHARALSFLKNKKFFLNHIMRENNTVADLLANRGIDKKISIPEEFKTFYEQ
jgi:ribonuclease HI